MFLGNMWKHQSSIARPACMEVAIITCSLFICVTQTLIRRSEANADLKESSRGNLARKAPNNIYSMMF